MLFRSTDDQRAYVARVFREAYRDLFSKRGPLSMREWRKVRVAEQAWR